MKLLIVAIAFTPLVGGEVANPCGGTTAFSVMNPDPNLLKWDTTPVPGKFVAGWLNAPVHHDKMLQALEKSPRMCLRIVMKPSKIQPAKLGPLLVHCGGPGSDASCIWGGGHGFPEIETDALGTPLADLYDYWSISQRGMEQQIAVTADPVPDCPFAGKTSPLGQNYGIWPNAGECESIRKVLAAYQAKNKLTDGINYILSKMDGNPDMNTWTTLLAPILEGPSVTLFPTNIFFNEDYVKWAYRLQVVNANLCFNDPKFVLNHQVPVGRRLGDAEQREMTANRVRVYNLMEYGGTSNLAWDMELVREAIGSKLLSIYGISYGTKVGSVYSTMFPEKVKHLILDGDMGTMPEVKDFAHWVGLSTEESLGGILAACQANAEKALPTAPAVEVCPAGPGIGRKMLDVWNPTAATAQDLADARSLGFLIDNVVYQPDVPYAPILTTCIECLYLKKGMKCCGHPHLEMSRWKGIGYAAQVAYVLGMDFAGRFTEPDLLAWWRQEIKKQPVGITRSLGMVLSVGVWPAIPRPQPPVGSTVVAPLVIGNLYDAQTPYSNAQRMVMQYTAGNLLTSQFYGHGLQGVDDKAVIARYKEQLEEGHIPIYDNHDAKLLCQRVFYTYLATGERARNYICKVKTPARTFGLVPVLTTVTTTTTTTTTITTTTTTTTTTSGVRLRLYEQPQAKTEIAKALTGDLSHSPVAIVSGMFALFALGSMALVAKRRYRRGEFNAVSSDLGFDEECEYE